MSLNYFIDGVKIVPGYYDFRTISKINQTISKKV